MRLLIIMTSLLLLELSTTKTFAEDYPINYTAAAREVLSVPFSNRADAQLITRQTAADVSIMINVIEEYLRQKIIVDCYNQGGEVESNYVHSDNIHSEKTWSEDVISSHSLVQMSGHGICEVPQKNNSDRNTNEYIKFVDSFDLQPEELDPYGDGFSEALGLKGIREARLLALDNFYFYKAPQYVKQKYGSDCSHTPIARRGEGIFVDTHVFDDKRASISGTKTGTISRAYAPLLIRCPISDSDEGGDGGDQH